jgi:hypothetical protein
MSCSIATYALQCTKRGDTYGSETWTFNMNLTSCTLHMSLRDARTLGPVKSFTTGDGFTSVSNGASSVVELDAFSVNWPAGNYVGDLTVTYADNSKETLMNVTMEVVNAY